MLSPDVANVFEIASFGNDTFAAFCQLDSGLQQKVEVQQELEKSLEKSHGSCNTSASSHCTEQKNTSLPETSHTSIIGGHDSISILCTQEKQDLKSWGLPEAVLKQYHSCGVKSMFPWQVECLCSPNVLDGGNLVYSAPTSAGKTLVAEILAIKTVMERKKKVIIILPFVSVVREKMFYFQDLLGSSGVRVEGLMGSHRIFGGFKKIQIAVCTIEKANSLINRLLEDGQIQDLGAVVVDELHLVGDPFRGYLLELLLTKVQYMNTREKNVSIQIIGMSATLPNLDLLAKWLNAGLYKTEFRPVPLQEFLKVESSIYDKKLQLHRVIQPEVTFQDDGDHVIYLCLETLLTGHSVLIFCPTKNWCESLAQHVAKEFQILGNSRHDMGCELRNQLNTTAIVEALEQLKRCPVGLDNVLKKTVSFGVAFHHAGLTIDERDIIEGLFRQGVLRVLVATSTLSSGVNLPARRVIIRSPLFCGEVIAIQTYRQMIGRAGRLGKDTEGESFLVCTKSEKRVGEKMIQSDLHPIESCLGFGELSSSLKRAVLEVVASGVATTPDEIDTYMNCTLLAASSSMLENPIKSCIRFLNENELIRLQNKDGETQYAPSPLGAACLAASIPPDDGLELFRELQRARQCFVLENDLHLVYQVTPLNIAAQWGNLDWFQVLTLWEQLPTSMRRVGELVGVEEVFMVRALRGTVNLQGKKEIGRANQRKMAVHRRFYTALALQDLINEVPLTEVANKFKCSKGMLQSLQQSASTYAGMVTAFCKRLGWDNMELLFSQFQDRLQFGIHRELCDLMRLDLLNGIRARALFNAGITTIASLAAADICEVENALHAAIPFQSSKELDGESSFDTAKRNEMKTVWITGRSGLTERDAAVLLIKEARCLVQKELGLADAKWEMMGEVLESSGYDSSSNGSPHTVHADKKDGSDNSMECSYTPQSKSNEPLEILEKSPHKNCEKLDHSNSFKMRLRSNCTQKTSDLCKQDRKNLQNKTAVRYDVSNCVTLQNGALQESDLKLTAEINQKSDLRDDICSPAESESCKQHNDLNDSSGANAINIPCKNLEEEEDIFLDRKSQKGTENNDVIENNDPFCASFSINNLESQIEVAENLSKDHSKSLVKTSSLDESVHERRSSRQSSDFFGTPSSENSYRSPSLFGDSFQINTQLCDVLDCDISPVSAANKTQKHYNLRRKENNCKTPEQLNSPKSITDSSTAQKDCAKQQVTELQLSDVLDCDISPVSAANKTQKHYNPRRKENNCKTPEQLNSPKSITDSSTGRKDCAKQQVTELQNALLPTDSFSDDSVITDSFLEKAFKTELALNSEIISPSDSDTNEINCQRATGNSVLSPVELKNASTKLTRKRKKLGMKNKENSNEIKVMMNPETPSKKVRLCTGVNSEKSPQTLLITLGKIPSEHKNSQTNSFHSNDSKNTKGKSLRFAKVPVFHSSSEEDEDSDETNVLVRSSQKNSMHSHRSRDKTECDNLNTPCKHTPQRITLCQKSVQSSSKKNENRKSDFIVKGCKKQLISTVSDVKLENGLVKKSSPARKSVSFGNSTDSIDIINVAGHKEIFAAFESELHHVDHFSLSLACEQYNTENNFAIGNKILGRKKKRVQEDKSLKFVHNERLAVGVAICCGGCNIYYISLKDETDSKDAVPLQERVIFLQKILASSTAAKSVSAFGVKEVFKAMFYCLGIELQCNVYDPKVADWLLNPEGREKNLQAMALEYCSEMSKVAVLGGPVRGVGSAALCHTSSVPAQQRAPAEALVTWHTVNAQLQLLKENSLFQVFEELEMATILCLARMEISGIGFSVKEAERLRNVLLNQMSSFENRAYKLAGHTFSLTSPADVSKVLFTELRLNPGKLPLGQKPSTNKEALLRLKQHHPLPEIILQWRKINTILTKTIYPLLNADSTERMFGHYITHTATGRISMHEPNMQNIPRDFDVYGCDGEKLSISMREAFVPKLGRVLLSADYSQLELRILAHLSNDQDLLDILNSGRDVFCGIASNWNKIPESEVTDKLRQHAKQVCYGMIYGIGTKALAEQLEVDENEASEFMETFKKAYPGVKKYIEETIKNCRTTGYVETLYGRKRFLPAISSPNQIIRAHAERQAVNSTIQGSAADVAKRGMVLVESSLAAVFSPNKPVVTRWQDSISNKKNPVTRRAELVLHLHDELLYEVTKADLQQVAQIVKCGMESAATLLVKLPVKVKSGSSWGCLVELNNLQ